jgi:hypothetical protein
MQFVVMASPGQIYTLHSRCSCVDNDFSFALEWRVERYQDAGCGKSINKGHNEGHNEGRWHLSYPHQANRGSQWP